MGKFSDYAIVKVEEDRVFLIDLNLGNKSVTNDAENVYVKIKKIFPNHRIIYRDTMGRWDEIVLDINLCDPEEFPKNISCGFLFYDEHLPNEEEISKFPISAFLR